MKEFWGIVMSLLLLLASLLAVAGLELRAQQRKLTIMTRQVERLAESPIDLVLTDLRMPRMGSQQLLEEIRRRGLKPLVIAMTAFEGESLSAEAWELGVVAFLQKPFGVAELLEAIARGLLGTFY